jgi:hypothetical protein
MARADPAARPGRGYGQGQPAAWREQDGEEPGRPTPELLARFHPETELRAPVGEHGAIVSGDRAREVLGFKPRHTWRDQLAPHDLPSG